MEVRLNSKMFHSAQYDLESRRLVLILRNGQRREFDDVPEHVFDDLQATKSAGSYYRKFIRNAYPLILP